MNHLGDVQFELGDTSAARASWQRTLEQLERVNPEDTERTALRAPVQEKLRRLDGTDRPRPTTRARIVPYKPD